MDLLLALFLWAAPGTMLPPPDPGTEPNTMDTRSVSGTIAAIDRSGPSITISTDDAPEVDDQGVSDRVVLHVDSSTRYSDGGEAIALDDLHSGDHVRASYTERDGRKVAVSISRVGSGDDEDEDEDDEAENPPDDEDEDDEPEEPPPLEPEVPPPLG